MSKKKVWYVRLWKRVKGPLWFTMTGLIVFVFVIHNCGSQGVGELVRTARNDSGCFTEKATYNKVKYHWSGYTYQVRLCSEHKLIYKCTRSVLSPWVCKKVK